MIPINSYKIYFYLTFLLYSILLIFFSTVIVQSEDSDVIIINADKIEIRDDGEVITANGNIRVKSPDFLSSSDKFNYDKKKEEIIATGNIIIKDKLKNYYYFDKFISDKNFNNSIGLNPKIQLNSGARIVGDKFSRKSSNINQIDNAIYTPCLQKGYIVDECPGWKLNAKKVIHDTEKNNIYYEGAVLSILNVPVLYAPFFSHPDPTVKKRTGILMPSFSSDNALGTTISIPFFYNISSNHDLTFTPNIQTKSDNYYNANYRYLSKNHEFDIDTSITDNDSNTGTKNHIFFNGTVNNAFGEVNYKFETSNNDTYLRKNHINEQTTLTSGLKYSKETKDSYFDFNTYVYKHLNNSNEQKWEYVYPSIDYNIYNYKDPIYKLNWKIENSLLNYKDINKNFNQQISSEIISKKVQISKKTGLRFENTIQNRLVYINNSLNNFNQLRIFPQLARKISLPLSKGLKNRTEILEPIIMTILAPYNNYINSAPVTNTHLFSLNRESKLSQWESGPRINYGINWLIKSDDVSINTIIGQVARINKESTDTIDEISNYFIRNTLDFGSTGYIKTDITIDRKDLYIKDNNINTSIMINKLKLGFDYDYETTNKIKTSEQISIGAKVDIFKDTNLTISIRKDLMSDKSIGNAFGLHYENDCLALNFDFFRDFVAVDDIKNSHGFSFTITLKPFGTSKQAGKVKNFGPEL